MPQPVTLVRVSQPCHERWDAMTPTAAGRHCAACQQVVVDFTHKTDAELLAYLARPAGNACGRFRADQLARPLRPAETTSRWRSWLASVLAVGGVLGGGRAAAQSGGHYYSAGPTPTAQPAAPVAEPLPAPAKAAVPALPSEPSDASGPLVVRGVVLDATSSEPLPGAMVVLEGTTHGANTDTSGRFELPLPAADAGRALVVASVGYDSERLPLAQVGPAPLTVQLQANRVLMGEVIVTYASRQPWPWHPRALYRRAKYLLLQPFRQ